ncbi:MAG TPA: hypothetical protein PLV06_05330 [Bacteroidales bacterium]|nr:hypothetical protein [Bacteroidales bacterium]HPF01734.1 hypothetical protein [Bacteroidales bacterium]HPJ59746.1 hypothetical protein [Bacteroidales bacterium]HPR11786.1 hypothetical protein [Bacteroidales bacterium]HRW84065.1 hypothetical protein [Bacteroidales bacterium]
MKKIIITICLLSSVILKAQTQENESQWGIKFSGFIKNDIFYDTRQSTAANGLREGHFYLFPDDISNDIMGNDLNANPSFHMLSIQSRIKGDITGPDAFGAKTSGLIEAEFFGTSESDLNGFRLRHAWVKLTWSTTSLLTGQYWHPMFPVESFPGTISFNTGAPFTPFSRNPQVRLTQEAGPVSFTFTAYAQRDFTSPGPDGNSNKYMRNATFPGLDLQVKIPAGDVFTAWAGIDYKKLRPELKTSVNVETDAMIKSYSVFGNVKIRTAPVNISLMGVYAQNGADLMMIGGYAVSEITSVISQQKIYTNLNTGNLWIDFATNGSKINAGIFSGFSKNLGSRKEIAGSVYGRGTDIDHLFRIAPRISFTGSRLSFCGEVEATAAAYGTRGSDGKVTGTHNVSNLRILLSTIYRF